MELENKLTDKEIKKYLNFKLLELINLKESNNLTLKTLNNFSLYFYENGITSIDLVNEYKNIEFDNEYNKSELLIYFDKIRPEFRFEKLLILLILKKIFFRSNDDLKSITTI